jgi:chemotaxis protein histidine kinase CheA
VGLDDNRDGKITQAESDKLKTEWADKALKNPGEYNVTKYNELSTLGSNIGLDDVLPLGKEGDQARAASAANTDLGKETLNVADEAEGLSEELDGIVDKAKETGVNEEEGDLYSELKKLLEKFGEAKTASGADSEKAEKTVKSDEAEAPAAAKGTESAKEAEATEAAAEVDSADPADPMAAIMKMLLEWITSMTGEKSATKAEGASSTEKSSVWETPKKAESASGSGSTPKASGGMGQMKQFLPLMMVMMMMMSMGKDQA